MSKTFSLADLAKTLNVEEKKIKNWIKEGWLFADKVKTEWYITEPDLVELLSKNPTLLLAGFSKGFADGRGKEASFYYPEGVAVDLEGTVYVADTKNHSIRKITQNGEVSTIAGSSEHAYVDGIGKEARFYSPSSIVIDSNGFVFVSDTMNHIIRKVSPDGKVTTFAGSGKKGFVDGQGKSAKFYRPNGLALDQNGNFYVVDTGNHAIRKIDSQGLVSTIAGGTMGYVDGIITSAKFSSPQGLAIDKQGNLYVADTENHVLRKISIDGTVSTIAGCGNNYRISENAVSPRDVYIYKPKSVVIDNEGNIYFSFNNSIGKLSIAEEFTVFAGEGKFPYKESLAKKAWFYEPHGLAIDCQGSIYVADTNGSKIRKILTPAIINNSFRKQNFLSEKVEAEVKIEPSSTQKSSLTIEPTVSEKPRKKFTIPRAEEFYCVYLDERNNPCGLMDNYDVIRKTAEQTDIEDILEVLENPIDTGQVIAALVITGSVLARKPSYTNRVQNVLLNLASDSRCYQAKIDGYNETVGMVGFMTNRPYYDIVNKKQDVEDKFLDITLGIDAALKNPLRANMSIGYNGLDAFCKLFNTVSATEREAKVKQLGEFFNEIILDKSRPSVERMTAYDLIGEEINRNRETKSAFQIIQRKAAQLLVNVLLDSEENKELQIYIKRDLNKIAPEAVDLLQRKGVLASRSVPKLPELMSSSDVSITELNNIAQEVSASEVLDILQNHRNEDSEKLFSAVYLSSIVARRFNWKAFAQALTNLLFVYKPTNFKTPYATVQKELSKESSQQLGYILKEHCESDKEIVLSYASKALEIILDRGFNYSHYSDAINWELKRVFNTLKADELLKNLLMDCFCASWRSPEARFLAYKELGWHAQDAHQKAWEILLDSSENATLRSLIGTIISNHVKKELESLVDTTQKPWQLLPKANAGLPISVPRDLVPEVWLIATLKMSSDAEVLKQAINSLSERLMIASCYSRDEFVKACEKILELQVKYPDLKNIFKKIYHKTKNINAARILALLGDLEEETTMIDLVTSGVDGWTTLKPLSSEWTGIGLLMSVLASNEVTDNVYSAFEPYLIIGYGDEKARLMMSKVFVVLAEKYQKEGKIDKAIKAYKWAIKRDGRNLEAREGLNKLEPN